MGMKQFANIYSGKRVIITGHTGFKGSWLALWLTELGAKVYGVALQPKTQISHWDLLKLPIRDYLLDIRNVDAIGEIFSDAKPEIVFHLAAQPLVRRSYRDPIETWSTNVMGTVNILEACRQQSSVRAIVAITSDKSYVNREWTWGYRENDQLGGHDPYSASKAGAELVAASYRNAFFNTDAAPLLATTRAGNVVGGGYWSEVRLLPDLIRAFELDQSLEIRSPNATRPWQHVLDCLNGYLLLVDALLEGRGGGAWNFGPDPRSFRSVADAANAAAGAWGGEAAWRRVHGDHPHEASLLTLDPSKARTHLGWADVLDFEASVAWTVDWTKQVQAGRSAHDVTLEQINAFSVR
jgi:CDP-glucose 4,6-dehydratase